MAKLINYFRGGLASSAAGFTLLAALVVPGLAPAALLNNTLNIPLISYDSGGTTTYDAATDVFSVDATALSLWVPPNLPVDITADATGARDFVINIEVDATGALIGGTPGDDLVVSGEVTVPGMVTAVSGVLLTGEVTGFGFQDSGTPSDNFDFSFTVTGGLLAYLYPGNVVGVKLASENSTFIDDFTINFAGGPAKGTLGGITPEPAALGDRVWEDLDADGIQDCTDGGAGAPDGIIGNAGDSGPECDSGIADVTVNLLDPGAGDCGSGDEWIIDSRQTDADGFYLFDNLDPGEYCVEIVKPAGFECTLDNQGSDDAADSDVVDQGDGTCQTLDPVQDPIDLAAGETDLNWDAGLVRPVAALGDRAWEDLDADGVQDCTDSNGNGILGDVDAGAPDDPTLSDQGAECGDRANGGAGIANVVVELLQLDSNGNCNMFMGQTVTGQDGFYLFEDLVPGDYCVKFGQPLTGFCDTDGFALGAAKFTTQNVDTNNVIDSDADPADGKTDPVSLAAGETNRNLDAGYVCPAKIGDFVWEDLDQNGFQGAEPGVGGVTVRLFECGPDGDAGTADDVDMMQSRKTSGDGMYMFGAEHGPGVPYFLPPGDYYVKFDPTTFPPGYDFTTPNAGEPNPNPGDEAIDSDCLPPDGMTSCTTLGSRGINLKQDCGIVPPPPPVCDLEVDLLCRVEPQPSTMVGEKCEGKLQQFTVTWNGPGPVSIAVNMGTTSTSGPINTGDEVTFFGPYGSNDVVVDISGAVNGQSKFHVSCSDDNFNSPDDCGKLAGDGKGDDGSLLNHWRLEGFIDDNGDVLDCNPDPNSGEFSQNCSLVLPPGPDCESLGKPSSLTFEYTGGACPGDNDQGSKTDCSGTIDPAQMVSVDVDTGDDYSVSPSLVAIGETFTITRNGSDFKSNTVIDLSNSGGTQQLEVHTSCSAPLAVGDEFGAITLVSFDGQTGGADVTYKYVVTNNGDPLVDIDVTDDPYGFVDTIPALGTNEMGMLTRLATINGTTTNVATASAALGGLVCMASDSVIVEELGPPPCEIVPDEFKLEDDKIKWKLENVGNDVATVESIEFSAPDEFGAIKKVKLDGDIFKDDTRPMTWTFTAADFINDLKNRQIKVGDRKELLFETTEKFKHATADQISITVNFEEGCSVTFVPGLQAFDCGDAKPIDSLSMIWNGPDGVDVMSPTGEMVNGVVNGQEVTFSGLSGMGNDIFWSIADAGAGVSGSSKFHVSCSDDAMDGPEDCGSAQGNGKDDDSSSLNLWLLEGLEGTNGIGLDCSLLP